MGLGTLTLTPNATAFPSMDPALVVPLTTTFTPTCYPYVRATDGAQCGPPEMRSVWGSLGFYSPGLCPEGYTTGCTRIPPGLDDFHPFEIVVNQTAISCVPLGFKCEEDKPTNNAYSVNAYGVTTWAPAFEIRYHDVDLENLFPSSTTSASSTTSTPATAPAKPAPPASTPTSHTANASVDNEDGGAGDSGIDTGAIIGIAMGGAAGLSLLLVGVLYMRHCTLESRRLHLMAPNSLRRPRSASSGGSDGSTELPVELDNRSTDVIVDGVSRRRFSFELYGADGGAAAEARVGRHEFVAELPGCMPPV